MVVTLALLTNCCISNEVLLNRWNFFLVPGQFGFLVIVYVFQHFGTFFFQNHFSGLPLIPLRVHQSRKKFPDPGCFSNVRTAICYCFFVYIRNVYLFISELSRYLNVQEAFLQVPLRELGQVGRAVEEGFGGVGGYSAGGAEVI